MKYILLLFTLTFTTIQAQDITGIATYQSKTDIDLKLESSSLSPEMMQKIQDKMKKNFEKTYTLKFNQNESVFQEEEQLDTPGLSGGSVQMVTVGGSFKGGKLYKNVTEESFVKESDISGKAFLIKDKLSAYEWELTNESKQIGQYVVFKAIAKEKIDTASFSKFFDKKATRKNKNNSDSIVSPLDELKIPAVRKIVAWYTPQIPIKTGPEDFWGLPGLILEINSGKTTMLCSKIVLNPNEEVLIEMPKKGKEISQEEFDKIMKEKTEEMMEMYSGKGNKGEGFQIEIKN